MDWQGFRFRHPRLFASIVVLKRFRTKVARLLVAYCVIEGLLCDEIPFSFWKPNAWVITGILLILVGCAFRLAAHGSIKKKESLSTTGVYSLCRHPLYLGSMMLTFGFCCLLDDTENFIIAAVYFAVFYTVTIIWEEVRVAERYGEEHRDYCRTTPLLLPTGQFRSGVFRWRGALGVDGLSLIGTTVFSLSAVEAMAELMHRH